MKEVVGVVFLIGLTLGILYLVTLRRIEFRHFTALLVFAAVASFGIANYDFIKRLRWKDVEIETFERRVTAVKQEALDEINKQVNDQKDSIRLLISNANDTRSLLEQQTKTVRGLLEKIEATQRDTAQSRQDVEAIRRRADEVRIRVEELNKASSDLALLLTKITWLQIETRSEFGTQRAQKAIADTIADLNRIVGVVIPDPRERQRWIEQMQKSLPSR